MMKNKTISEAIEDLIIVEEEEEVVEEEEALQEALEIGTTLVMEEDVVEEEVVLIIEEVLTTGIFLVYFLDKEDLDLDKMIIILEKEISIKKETLTIETIIEHLTILHSNNTIILVKTILIASKQLFKEATLHLLLLQLDKFNIILLISNNLLILKLFKKNQII